MIDIDSLMPKSIKGRVDVSDMSTSPKAFFALNTPSFRTTTLTLVGGVQLEIVIDMYASSSLNPKLRVLRGDR